MRMLTSVGSAPDLCNLKQSVIVTCRVGQWDATITLVKEGTNIADQTMPKETSRKGGGSSSPAKVRGAKKQQAAKRQRRKRRKMKLTEFESILHSLMMTSGFQPIRNEVQESNLRGCPVVPFMRRPRHDVPGGVLLYSAVVIKTMQSPSERVESAWHHDADPTLQPICPLK